MVPLLLLGLLLTVSARPLPSAILPPNPLNNDWGNMFSSEAVDDIKFFSGKLLRDPTGQYPWKRHILQVSSYGAISGDGQDDWQGIYKAINAACKLSNTLYQNYTTMTTNNPSMMKLPSGPEDRPVLVELRFDRNGVYDLAQGISSPSSSCAYVLYNGQNSTIRTHFEKGWSTSHLTAGMWDSRIILPCGGSLPQYAYHFNLMNYLPGTTIGMVTNIVKFPNGTTQAIDVQASPLHLSFDDGQIVYQPVDQEGKIVLYDVPVSIYGGYAGIVSSPTPNRVGGTMRIIINPRDFVTIGNHIRVGQHLGVKRGFTLNLGGCFTVTMSINLNELGNWLGYPAVNADVIDVHQNQLTHIRYVFGNGPFDTTSIGGQYRVWHCSIEGGSDDALDNYFHVFDIVALDPTKNAIQVQITSGYQKNTDWPLPSPGNYLAFGRYPDVYNYVGTAYSVGGSWSGDTAWLTLDSMPNLEIGDIVFNMNGNPTLSHVKNVRGGNHQFNFFNIKGVSVLVEKSYFYNVTMAAVDVSSDTWIWHEGNPVRNFTVVNNVFYNCWTAISHAPTANNSEAAISAAYSGIVSNNTIWHNESTLFWASNRAIFISSMANMKMEHNTIWRTPGMGSVYPVIGLCNVQNSTIANNNIIESTFVAGLGGEDCQGTVCRPFPTSLLLYIYTKNGCTAALTKNIQYSGNSFPNPQ